MNLHIRQLAEQANIHFSRVGILDGDPNGSARMVGYSKMEKFAELIVQECVTVMYDDAIERKVPPDINQTPTHYAVAVLAHFGVSESPPRLDTMVATNPLTQQPGVLPNTSEGIEPNRNQFGYPFSVDSRNKK